MTAQLVPETGHDAPPPAAPHPLDPLSADEIRAAAAILRAQAELTPATRFVMISLAEPPKPAGLDFGRGPAPDRVALVITYDTAASLIHEALVSLTSGSVVSRVAVPDRFPSYIVEDMSTVEELVREDPRWQAAMRLRGVTDFSLAMIDPWPSGYLGPSDHPAVSGRLCRPLTWMRSAAGEQFQALQVGVVEIETSDDLMVEQGQLDAQFTQRLLDLVAEPPPAPDRRPVLRIAGRWSSEVTLRYFDIHMICFSYLMSYVR